MKAFFNYIKTRIETRIPTLKVHLFNDQFTKADIDRTEQAIIYPVCYVEFIINEVNNYCLGIKDYFLTVRFRFGIVSHKVERLETFDFCDTFYQAVHLMRPSDVSGLIFTSFQEVTPEFDEDHKNVDRPYIDYRTRYRSTVAYNVGTAITPVDLEIDFFLSEPLPAVGVFDNTFAKPPFE